MDNEHTTPRVGDTFHTVTHTELQEIWKVVDTDPAGRVAVRQIIENQEFTRILENTDHGWRCLDDPDEFATITHQPRTEDV